MSKKAILVTCLIIVGVLTALIIPLWWNVFPDPYGIKYQEDAYYYSIKLYNNGECNISTNRRTTLQKAFLKGLSEYKSDVKKLFVTGLYNNIEESAFSYFPMVETIDLSGEELITIEQYAFQGCALLKSINFPSSVTTIKRGAFEGCASLKAISIPSSVEKFERSVFENCNSLEKVTFSSRVYYIGIDAFRNCSSLKTISPLYNLERICENAFANCSNLEPITIYTGNRARNTVILKGAFDGCPETAFLQYGNAYYFGNADNPYEVLIKAKNDETSCKVHTQTKLIAENAFANTKVSKINYDGTLDEFMRKKPSDFGQSCDVCCSDGYRHTR